MIKSKNSLPAICGRVCPQEGQCQMRCIKGKKGDPRQHRAPGTFLADWERENECQMPLKEAATGKKVAIIGAGPAGLTAASDLVKLGHEVTLFEALHVGGGVLSYGIPEFRLPKEIVQEIDYVRKLGVELRLGNLIGRIHTIPELMTQGYDAIFIGSGAGLPQWTGCPGRAWGHLFCQRVPHPGQSDEGLCLPGKDTPIRIGKHVVVIGGGNVAIDCARISMRLGATVCLNYRRSRNELPARREIENAEEEGIRGKFLSAPVEFFGDDKGWVRVDEVHLHGADRTGRERTAGRPTHRLLGLRDTRSTPSSWPSGRPRTSSSSTPRQD